MCHGLRFSPAGAPHRTNCRWNNPLMLRRFALVSVLLLPALPLQAQDATERAQRAADNPFRMILEAAKIKTRKPGEKAPERTAEKAAEKAPEKPVEKVVAAPRAAASAPVARSAPRVESEPAAVAVAPAAPAAVPEVPLVVVETPTREQPESAVATVEVAAAAPLPASPEPEPAAPEPLRLLDVVEPVVPRALIGQLRGDVRAHVAFTVAQDGAVREARMQSITHPLMSSSVLSAVRQWRYQPIPEPRAHEVEIVLRQD